MSDPKLRSEILLDEKWALTPDMGEYLDNDMILEAASEISNGIEEAEFCFETPFATAPGYYPTENVIIISGKPTFQSDQYGDDGLNSTDGDTVYLNYKEIIDDGIKHKFNNKEQMTTIKEYLYSIADLMNTDGTSKDSTIGLRFLGINTPELPHFGYYNPKLFNFKSIKMKYSDLSTKNSEDKISTPIGNFPKSRFNYVKYSLDSNGQATLRKMDDEIEFLYKDEINDETEKIETFFYEKSISKSGKDTILLAHSTNNHDEDLEYHRQGLDTQRLVFDEINEATEVIYMIDQTYISNKANGRIPDQYKKEYEKIAQNPVYAFTSLWKNLTQEGTSAYQQRGRRYFGLEGNGRFLAACYIKKNIPGFGERWINIGKRIAQQFNKVEVLPQFNSSPYEASEYGSVSDAFKLWSYDKSKQHYIDRLDDFRSKKGGDDRNEVQKAITGLDLSELTNHTVMIGDCLLMIPPTSIRMVSQSRSERITMLRAKNSMTKSIPKSERLLEMTLFFNGDEGINGIPYEQETPSGTKLKFHMNGLRSLVSQFKFTPFLPIHNDYINYVLNIEAVSLVSYQVSTVPNYPRTLQVTIRLQDFDYRQYMPELLPPNPEEREDIFTNVFSKTIHFPVMRYYYQRAMIQGNKISTIAFDSPEYIEATLGQKTALQPMNFASPLFELYVANEEHLKQRNQLKKSLENNPIESVITFTKDEEAMLKNICTMFQNVKESMATSEDLVKQLFEVTLPSPTPDKALVLYHRDTSKEKTIDEIIISKNPNAVMGIFHGNKKTLPQYDQMGQEIDPVISYIPSKTRKDLFDFPMSQIISNLKNGLFKDGFDHKYIKDCKFVYKQQAHPNAWENKTFLLDFKWGLEITINWHLVGSVNTIDKVRRMLAKSLNLVLEDIFKEDTIFLGFTTLFKKSESSTDSLMLESAGGASIDKGTDYKVLSKLSSTFQMVGNNDTPDDFWGTSNELGDMKDDIDLESDKSIKFDLYPIGFPIVNNMSFSYNNLFTSLSLKAYDGYACQYTGGSDTSIEINMTARDEFTVNQLNTLSRVCVQRLIDFRKIMASSPLRINSELTRFMGVNEVIIESIEINTIPNYPGTWDISMRLSSVDRTLRNREALKKVKNVDNTETNMDNVIKTKNFFEVKNSLSKVEVYPDLELPTISELEHLGYYYIRYKSDGSRIFPDADFYFSYLHVYSSEMFRESIVNFFKDSANTSIHRELSGDLFKETKEINYTIGKDKENKDPKRTMNDLIEEVTSINNGGNEKDLARIIELLNNEKFEETEFSNVKEKLSGLKAKVNSMNESVMAMREVVGSSNFDSYDFNPIVKISVKDKSYFNEEHSNLLGKKSIRTYTRSGKFKEITSSDKVKDMNASLKELILEIIEQPILITKANHDTGKDYPKYDKNAKATCSSVTESVRYDELFKYLINDIGGNIFGRPKDMSYTFGKGIDKTFSFKQMLTSILLGAAKGATAMCGEFDCDKSEETDPRGSITKNIVIDDPDNPGVKKQISKTFANVVYPASGQGLSTLLLADTSEQLKQGIIFGAYGIKKYSPSMLMSIYGIELNTATDGFLDPYYNKDLYKSVCGKDVSDEEMEERLNEYTHHIINTEAYSEHAFFRNSLLWLYKLLSDDTLLPTPIYLMGEMGAILEKAEDLDDAWYQNLWQSMKNNGVFGLGGNKSTVEKLEKKKEKGVFSSEQQEKLIAKQTEANLMDSEKTLEKEMEQMIKDVKADLPRYRLSLLCGLFTTLSSLTLTEFNTPIYTAVKSGDMASYIKYIERLKASRLNTDDLTQEDLKIRRLYQYLDSMFDTKSDYEKIGYKGPADKYSSEGKTNRIYLQAADTPSIYLMHSFYDMVMTDMRGRMARAFPTYYMLLVDEGRDMGVWRLQDNFYDVSSITEFQVVKSRKIAADTAKIVMTNLFGTFTTEDDDMKDEYQYTFKDTWNSIFSPEKYVRKEYNRRTESRDINRAKLKPGARVHLRMGYSSDAAKLPIMFNGSVAEVIPGDLMTIICQGDGVELANPAMFNPSDAKDVADLEYNDNLISGFLGAFKDKTTPRDILLNPLIAEGTFLQELIKDWSKGRLFNANPFGIVHFGDKHFRDIFTNSGEVEQNIYEALSKPSWGRSVSVDSGEYSYSLNEAPEIKVGLTGNRSYWDLMHIAASVSPDFISAIMPFQMRSSVFFGHPRYYCAYDYDKLSNGQIVEKRKPFQQYHIYTSYTDIISNTITSSDKEVRTCAVGIYHGAGAFGTKTKSVGPLYVDMDIYPEKQKMTTINCNFEYVNFDLIPFNIPIVNWAMDELSENGGYQTAWRATAHGLKESIKDMYTGELLVMGDPSVKPYDKMLIHDIYEDMNGMCEVEAVTHTFSTESGFVTSITPDCISAIDNKYEQIAHSTFKDVMLPALATHGALCANAALFAKINRAFFYSASQAVSTFGNAAEGVVNSIGKMIGKDELVKHAGITDKILANTGFGFGVTATDYIVYNTINKMSDGYSSLIKKRSYKSGNDFAGLLDDILDFDKSLGKLSPDDLIAELSKLDQTDEVKTAINNAKTLKSEHGKISKQTLESIEFKKNEIRTIIDKAELGKLKGTQYSDEVKDALAHLNKLENIKYGSPTFTKDMEALKKIGINVDKFEDGSDIMKIINKFDNPTTGKGVFNAAKAGLSSFDDLHDTFKGINAVRKGAGSLKSVLAMNVFWLAAELVLTKSIQEFLERKLKNMQVLTIFPIMKNGKAYVAGLDGHKGSVFNSPAYSEVGFMENMAIKFFEKKEGVLGGAMNILRDLFITTDEMRKTVDGFKRDNGYGIPEGATNETKMLEEQTNLMTQLAKRNISGFTAYKKLYFDLRVKSPNDQDGLAVFREHKLIDISLTELQQTKVLANNLVRIDAGNFELLNKLRENGAFFFAGEKEAKSDNGKTKFKTEYITVLSEAEGTNPVNVPAKIFENKAGKPTVYSLPYLRNDAVIVLMMIIEETCKKLQPDYESDECKFEYLKEHPIILHNGVRINQSNSWFSTGYAFTLEVKNYNQFGNILNEINNKDTDIAKSTESGFKLFNIDKDKELGGDTYNILVSPKKLGIEEVN